MKILKVRVSDALVSRERRMEINDYLEWEQKRYPIESSGESIEGEIEWLLTKDQIKLWSTFVDHGTGRVWLGKKKMQIPVTSSGDEIDKAMKKMVRLASMDFDRIIKERDKDNKKKK